MTNHVVGLKNLINILEKNEFKIKNKKMRSRIYLPTDLPTNAKFSSKILKKIQSIVCKVNLCEF